MPSACQLIEAYRRHPRWMIIGFSSQGSPLHDRLWQLATSPAFTYRKLYDVRTALTLLDHGVTEFATLNTRDFEGLGFARVWNPFAAEDA